MRKIGSITNSADDNDEFTNGHAAAGKKPTVFFAEWFNTIQRELVAVVEGAGIPLNESDDEQISKIIGKMSSVISHYRSYGYPLWEQGIPYYPGAVVYHGDGLYLSLSDNNRGNVPGTDESIWQPYIQRESTKEEAILGEGSTQVITPRRLHDGASHLDEQLKAALTPYLLPIGAIIMWPGITPPDGWLELNGQQFDATKNPKLAAMFPGGRVPDYRGRFVRAWAHGSTTDPDPDRPVGSNQDDAVQKITGEFQTLDLGSATPSGVFKHEFRGGALVSGSFVGAYHSIVSLDSSREVRTADESRPKNIAAMYIIKTDLADSTPGSQTPTAIVVTPQSATVNAGTTRQFSAAVLPSQFQNDYPVSWAVSDTSLGSISASGIYTAAAGQTGTQTIIASISTGLTQTVTLNQYVYLTGISIAAVPSMEVEDTYNLSVTLTPSNFTEPVGYASSDAQIASVVNGTVTGVGAGTATVSLAGRYSGVTASRQVTITPKVIVEKYLQINENLSEIAEKGAVAQGEARNNLGLKSLATKESLTASDVSAVPQADTSLNTENLNTVVAPGRKFQSLTSNATVARNYPIALAGMLDVIKTTGTGIRQTFYPYNTTEVYHRYCVDVGANPIVFSAWGKSGGDYLDKSQNLADVSDKSLARNNMGVGYTISTAAPPSDTSAYAVGHIWYQVES